MLFVVISTCSWLWGSYNSLVVSSSNVDTTYAAVQSQYQRRFDLVPNLAEATKGFLKQEQAVFGAIAEARTHYANSKGTEGEIDATNQYNSALARLMVVIENYPDLKSNQTVASLMAELEGTENRINVSRDRYNESVRVYNIQTKSFPINLIASSLGFKERQMFQAEKTADKGVKIKLTE